MTRSNRHGTLGKRNKQKLCLYDEIGNGMGMEGEGERERGTEIERWGGKALMCYHVLHDKA